MGPIIILDKSTFQSLSYYEHIYLDKYFYENNTPILCMELLGDLTKYEPNKEEGKKEVSELSKKFCGSGPVTNYDYRTLCVCSLLGQNIPLDGRIIPDNYTPVKSSDGTECGIIEPGPFNMAIMRWSDGDYQELEYIFSEYWRMITKNISFEALNKHLDENYVIIPKVNKKEEVLTMVHQLLDNNKLQDIFFNWILDQMHVDQGCHHKIKERWAKTKIKYLEYFAKYAWYCTKVIFTLIIATRSSLLKWKPTNYLDIQYLYYLPFCMVFASNDRIHQFLAPLLIRNDQDFINGKELKEDLIRIEKRFNSYNEKQRRLLSYALGSYPFPDKNSIIYRLWKKHMRPWYPDGGDLAIQLSKNEKQEANDLVSRMFEKIEGKYYPFQDIYNNLK